MADLLAPENLTRYLMLDMTTGTEFTWLSASGLYENAKNVQPASFTPPLLRGKLVNPEAMRWAMKRLTGQSPGILLFDSVADASSRDGFNSILSTPVLSERSFAATVKLQQAMLFALNHANSLRGYDWRIAYVMLEHAKIPGLDFNHAVELVTGKSGLNGDSAIDVYINEVRDKIADYFSFCNRAIMAFDKSLGPVFNIQHAYKALLILTRSDFQSEIKEVLTRGDIRAEMEKTGATTEDVMFPADRPLADIERNIFKIGSNIFGVSANGLNLGSAHHA